MFFESIVIALLIPIAFGWVFLFLWPVIIAFFFLTIEATDWLKSKFNIQLDKNLKLVESIHDLLFSRIEIPWSKIYSSIELSSNSKTVTNWMNQLGVHDSNARSNSNFNKFEFSYPETYDLVTDIINCNKNLNLEDQYHRASLYMNKGAFYIDIEESPLNHSLQSHITAAEKYGLLLIERSDKLSKMREKVSRGPWSFKNYNSFVVMLVWNKV